MNFSCKSSSKTTLFFTIYSILNKFGLQGCSDISWVFHGISKRATLYYTLQCTTIVSLSSPPTLHSSSLWSLDDMDRQATLCHQGDAKVTLVERELSFWHSTSASEYSLKPRSGGLVLSRIFPTHPDTQDPGSSKSPHFYHSPHLSGVKHKPHIIAFVE